MDTYQIYKTPDEFDDIILRSDGRYLSGLVFLGSRDMRKMSAENIKTDRPEFRETVKWLDLYFEKKIPDFVPEYRIEGLTPFRKEVLDIVADIPYGQTMSYGDIAEKIAKRKGIERMSAQAVGQAVGWNPICLIIPCHRVIGSGGDLAGYGGGLSNKIALLKLEGNDMNKYHLPK